MTKLVRIENADTSKYKVVVEVWQKRGEGQPDEKVSEKLLNFPTALVEAHVWDSQYLIDRENGVSSE